MRNYKYQFRFSKLISDKSTNDALEKESQLSATAYLNALFKKQGGLDKIHTIIDRLNTGGSYARYLEVYRLQPRNHQGHNSKEIDPIVRHLADGFGELFRLQCIYNTIYFAKQNNLVLKNGKQKLKPPARLNSICTRFLYEINVAHRELAEDFAKLVINRTQGCDGEIPFIPNTIFDFMLRTTLKKPSKELTPIQQKLHSQIKKHKLQYSGFRLKRPPKWLRWLRGRDTRAKYSINILNKQTFFNALYERQDDTNFKQLQDALVKEAQDIDNKLGELLPIVHGKARNMLNAWSANLQQMVTQSFVQQFKLVWRRGPAYHDMQLLNKYAPAEIKADLATLTQAIAENNFNVQILACIDHINNYFVGGLAITPKGYMTAHIMDVRTDMLQEQHTNKVADKTLEHELKMSLIRIRGMGADKILDYPMTYAQADKLLRLAIGEDTKAMIRDLSHEKTQVTSQFNRLIDALSQVFLSKKSIKEKRRALYDYLEYGADQKSEFNYPINSEFAFQR